MRDTTTKPDRIDRAIVIIRTGNKILKVDYYSNGGLVWFVESSDGKTNYRVTEQGCTCPDARNGICKHQWATIGADAAMLIHKMRQASGLLALCEIAELYAPAMAELPAGFLRVAREEYRQVKTRLLSRITFDEEVAA